MNRAELYAAVWDRPILHLAQEWGVSDSWVRLLCTKHNVPLPGRGYWPKLKAGQVVQRLPLPDGQDAEINLKSTPKGAGAENQAAVASIPVSDLCIDLAMVERDAWPALRHRALEEMLLDVGVSLALTPGLDVNAWTHWFRTLQAEVKRRAPEIRTVPWAIDAFKAKAK